MHSLQSRPIQLVIAFACAVMFTACYDTRGSSNIMIKMGPDVSADIVYLFKENVSWDEILEFERSVVGTPQESPTRFMSHPSIMSMVAVRVRGHESHAVNFKPRATDDEKADYKRRVIESPLIYAVYENVIPSRITGSTIPTYQSK